MLRRLFLAAPAAIAAPAASAFRLETIGAEDRDAYGNGCRRADLHDGLSAEIGRLAEGVDLSAERRAAFERLRACPFCGCALAAGQPDHGEDAPPG